MRQAGADLSSVAPTRAAVGRADLLRLLSTLASDEFDHAAELLGYERERSDDSPPKDDDAKGTHAQVLPGPREPTPAVGKPPLRARQVALLHRRTLVARVSPPSYRESGPLIDRFDGSREAAGFDGALSPARRIAVFLRDTLRVVRPGRALDTRRLLTALCRLHLPRTLPRRPRPRWSEDAALVIDIQARVQPMLDDLIALAEQAHGQTGGRIRVLAHLPDGRWLMRGPCREPAWSECDERTLWACRVWLLAGDLGSSKGGGKHLRCEETWVTRMHRHCRRGGSVVALVGEASRDWCNALPRNMPLALWDYGQRLHARRAARMASPALDIEPLLDGLSIAVRVEPALLREMRLALGLPLAAELQAWKHADVHSETLGLHIRPERLSYRRQRLREQPLAQRQRLAGIVASQHRGLSRLIRFEEAALAADLAELPSGAVEHDWAAVARTLRQAPPHSPVAVDARRYLLRAGARAHEELWSAVPALSDAYVIACETALAEGAALPDGVRADSLENLGPGQGTPRALYLLQRGAGVVLDIRPPGLTGESLLLECPPAQGYLLSAGRGSAWHAVPGHPVSIADIVDDMPPIRLRTRDIDAAVALIPRPSWALEWGRDRLGLYALAPSPLGAPVKLYWATPESPPAPWPPGPRGFLAQPVALTPALQLGADLDFGLYLDLSVGSEVQRLRWMEAGEFWMGSPEGEAGRVGDEGPRHKVRLTRGFWLAETACSQGLWSAVTGGNPSRFEGADRPVEQVSWDDVQGFLRALEGRLGGGVIADLPTEAEWEYACRAGSDGGYSWGEELSDSQANVEGRSGGTVEVRRYEANKWGLYQMHGNVWEWCADGQRAYDGEDQVDPRGPEGDVAARVARSACRGGRHRGDRFGNLGFRLALRSTSPGGAAEQPDPGAQATGRRLRGDAVPRLPARRDAGPATRSRKTSKKGK